MNDDIVPLAFDSAKLCECYSALDETLTRESTFSWSDGSNVSLGANGSGGWFLTDLSTGSTWSASGWDGSGCHDFTLSLGTGEATVTVCCTPCGPDEGEHDGDIGPLSARPAFYEWNAAAQKWVKLMDRDPEPPADLPPGTFDGQIKEV